MKIIGMILFFLCASSAIAAPECDCTTYPFKPNPPCYGHCIGKLLSKKDIDLFAIKGLDPGVSVSIKVLSSSPDKSDIDFAKIHDKQDLEGVALKSLENKNIKLEVVPSSNLQQ
jgi:hypothetical protein